MVDNHVYKCLGKDERIVDYRLKCNDLMKKLFFATSSLFENVSVCLDNKLTVEVSLELRSNYESKQKVKGLQTLQVEMNGANEQASDYEKEIKTYENSIKKIEETILPHLNERLEENLVKLEQKNIIISSVLKKTIHCLGAERRRSGLGNVMTELARLQELLSLRIDINKPDKKLSFIFTNIDPLEPSKSYTITYKFLSKSSLQLEACEPVVQEMGQLETVQVADNFEWHSFLLKMRNLLKQNSSNSQNK